MIGHENIRYEKVGLYAEGIVGMIGYENIRYEKVGKYVEDSWYDRV